MNLLRSLQFHRIRASHIATGLSFNTSRARVATSVFSSFTGTRWPLFARDGKDTSRCFSVPNFVCRDLCVTHRCAGTLSENADRNSLSEKLPAVESVRPKCESDDTATVTTDSLLVKEQMPLSKDVLKSDFDSEKTESLIHIDESQRELVVYVGNELVKTKAKDLYKAIRKMDSEQVDL